MGHARNDTTGKAHATFEIIREHRARQPVFGRVREFKRMIFIPRFQDRQHRPVCSLLGEMPASNLKGASPPPFSVSWGSVVRADEFARRQYPVYALLGDAFQ